MRRGVILHSAPLPASPVSPLLFLSNSALCEKSGSGITDPAGSTHEIAKIGLMFRNEKGEGRTGNTGGEQRAVEAGRRESHPFT